jgi:hypothetical protein
VNLSSVRFWKVTPLARPLGRPLDRLLARPVVRPLGRLLMTPRHRPEHPRRRKVSNIDPPIPTPLHPVSVYCANDGNDEC